MPSINSKNLSSNNVKTTNPQTKTRRTKEPRPTQTQPTKRTNDTSLPLDNSTIKRQYRKKSSKESGILTEYEAEVEANKLLTSFEDTDCHSTPNHSITK